jgi:hypothetical protein
VLLGHVLYDDGILVDGAKIVVIVNMQAPTNFHTLLLTLAHTRYYRKIFKSYAKLKEIMEGYKTIMKHLYG